MVVEFQARELTVSEVDYVSGGAAPIVGIVGGCIGGAIVDKINGGDDPVGACLIGGAMMAGGIGLKAMAVNAGLKGGEAAAAGAVGATGGGSVISSLWARLRQK